MNTRKPCPIEGCTEHVYALGYCRRHYGRLKRWGDPRAFRRKVWAGVSCLVLDCSRPVYSKGLCSAHYQRSLTGRPLDAPIERHPVRPKAAACSVNGCTRPVKCVALCRFHYRRQQLGIPLDAPSRAQRGRGYVAEDGYRYVCSYGHPNARANGAIAEHRLIMSRLPGRPLYPDETVHHINGVRDDNRPENRELWSKGQPAGQRVADKVAWARVLLSRYGSAQEQAIVSQLLENST